MLPQWISKDEALVIMKLVGAILDEPDLYISVNDGEETVLRHSHQWDQISAEIGQTDVTNLIVSRRYYDGENEAWKRLGFFMLIHGNDEDVIADHTATPLFDEIFKKAIEDWEDAAA